MPKYGMPPPPQMQQTRPLPQQAQQDAKRRGQQKAMSTLNVDFGKTQKSIPLPPLGRR